VKILKACLCPECEPKLGRSVKIDKNILDVEAGVPQNVNEYTHPIFKKVKYYIKILKHKNILII